MNLIDLLFTQSSICPPVLPFAVFLSYFSVELQKQRVISTYLSKQNRVKTGLALFAKDFLKKRCPYLLPPIALPRKLFVERLPDPPFFTYAPPRYFWHPQIARKPYEYVDPKPLLRERKEEIELDKYAYTFLAYAKSSLPHTGTIHVDGRGFVYVNVSEKYIDALLPLLPSNAERPSNFYEGPKGAYFALMLPQEMNSKKGLGKFKEIDQEISFIPTGVYSVQPEGWSEMERVWILTLYSPQAEAIRERYLLPSKIRSHEFHIVIGVKRKNQFTKETAKKETFRINVSCYAA